VVGFIHNNNKQKDYLAPRAIAVSPGRADSLQKAQGNLPIRSVR